MLKFNLVSGKITFLTHKVEWAEKEVTKQRECYSLGQANSLVVRLTERNATATTTELEQPTPEQLANVEGKIFNTYEEALAFVETGIMVKTELQILQETVDALVLSALEV